MIRVLVAEDSVTTRDLLVAIATSTGGPAALQRLFSDLPGDFPVPILAVQHMAGGFVEGLASWLNGASSVKVKVAEDGEPLAARTAYLAPPRPHLGISGRSAIAAGLADAVLPLSDIARSLVEVA